MIQVAIRLTLPLCEMFKVDDNTIANENNYESYK